MTSTDYNEIIELWKHTQGIGITPSDTHEKVSLFLKRNPGLCFVALNDTTIIGTVLCGRDGRRGYLYHLAVREEYRRNGIGTDLVNRSLAALRDMHIEKCHLFVFENNTEAVNYYRKNGWKERIDLKVFSKSL